MRPFVRVMVREWALRRALESRRGDWQYSSPILRTILRDFSRCGCSLSPLLWPWLKFLSRQWREPGSTKRRTRRQFAALLLDNEQIKGALSARLCLSLIFGRIPIDGGSYGKR